MSGRWQHRVHPPSGSPPLSQVQAAVKNLADLFGVPANSKARVAFQAVADVALLGAVVVSGTLATVHLYRTLLRRHKEKDAPEPTAGDGAPPHRPRTARAMAGGQDGHEKSGFRSL